MAFKMLSPEGKCLSYAIQPECLYHTARVPIPYSLSAYVLTIIASVCRLWASVLDFQEFDKVIRMLNIKSLKGIGSNNP